MESLSTIDDLDNEPTAEELSKAITLVAPWKAPVSDGIPANLLQHCKHDIIVKCWREGMAPQDMCDAKIITLDGLTVLVCNLEALYQIHFRLKLLAVYYYVLLFVY